MVVCRKTEGFTADSAVVWLQHKVNSLNVSSKAALQNEAGITPFLIVLNRLLFDSISEGTLICWTGITIFPCHGVL